jgi:hypothetical protein
LLVNAHRGRCCLYLALYCFSELGVVFAMSNLRFSKAAVENMALLLATKVEPREIARIYRCHAATVYRIKQNVELFKDPRPAPLVVIGRP